VLAVISMLPPPPHPYFFSYRFFLLQIVVQDGEMEDVGALECESSTVVQLAAARAGRSATLQGHTLYCGEIANAVKIFSVNHRFSYVFPLFRFLLSFAILDC
jgi:hypothetical protein